MPFSTVTAFRRILLRNFLCKRSGYYTDRIISKMNNLWRILYTGWPRKKVKPLPKYQ